MSPRVTRASAAKEAVALPKSEEAAAQQSTIVNATKEQSKERPVFDLPTRGARGKKNQNRTKSAAKPAKNEDDPNELPHNLGKVNISKIEGRNDEKDELVDEPATKKRKKGNPKEAATGTEARKDIVKGDAVGKKKKTAGSDNPHNLTPGVSPYPNWPHPTFEECQVVVDRLSDVHGAQIAPAAFPAPSLTVSGCGEVPSVLDALIRTTLSAATSKANSSSAFQGLVDKFGILKEGIGKGSIDWESVRRAPLLDVYDAIKSGGLAATKSARIQNILGMVYEENHARRVALVESSYADPPGAENETPSQKMAEIARVEENMLSLDHLHALSTHEAMLAMLKYPGIGIKTASCVLLFCMRRPSLAVDTHVFRLLTWLKWIPPQARNEVAAFKHVDAVVPDQFKYALHQLFIKHGQRCTRCKAATREGCTGWEEPCAIEDLVERTKKAHVAKGTKKDKPKSEDSDSQPDKMDIDGSDEEETSLLPTRKLKISKRISDPKRIPDPKLKISKRISDPKRIPDPKPKKPIARKQKVKVTVASTSSSPLSSLPPSPSPERDNGDSLEDGDGN